MPRDTDTNDQLQVTFGSVCSGIEAASVAWHPLGWKAAWLSEIEPAPCQLLAHHYPEVPNLGNMLAIPAMLRNNDIPAPDVFTGGTPCQAFSLAGLRNSLGDARGNLSLTFCEIANEIDIQRAANGLLPCIVKWENVPGVLSTQDNAFGCFLAGLAGEDETLVPEPCPPAGKSGRFWKWNKASGTHALSWPKSGCVVGPQRTVCWRVLDAQFFGVAQRRRRVFVVASARDGFDPAAILLEFDGVRRDSPPSRSAREEIAGTLNARTDGGGFPGTDESCSGYVQPVVSTLDASYGRLQGCSVQDANHGHSHLVPVATPPIAFSSKDYGADATVDLAPTMRAMNHSTSHQNGGDQLGVAYAIQAGALRTNPLSGPDGVGVQADISYTLEARAEVQAVCVTGDITHTLKAEGFDASEDGTGRGQPIVAAFAENSRAELRYEDGDGQITGTLSTGGGKPGQGTPTIQMGMAVRRLMPIECERLQGFPDNYTRIPLPGRRKDDHGEPRYMADGPRYKALGNSWAVPNVYWIGKRIHDQLISLEKA